MEKQYHTNLSKEDLKGARYAIITGDPDRVHIIASYMDNPSFITQKRGYTSYLGYVNNKPVLVISHGIGGPSVAIIVEEIANLGIESIIRVGTSGGIQLNVNAGDLVIANASIRQEGTTRQYAPIEFPAVANFDIVRALKESADELKYPNHIGIVQCKDSFAGQHHPELMPVSYDLETKWEAWKDLGALCSEMETATLYIISSYLKIRSAAILTVVWNQEQKKKGISQEKNFDTNKEIEVAVNALKKLII